MLFTGLFTLPIAWITDFVREPQVEEITEQLQWTSLDGQDIEPSPEMPQNLHTDHTDASGDGWTTVGSRANGRREGPPRPSGSAVHKYHGERLPNRGSQLQLRPRTQAVRLRNLESDYHHLAGEYESLQHGHRQLSEAHKITAASLHETQTTCGKQKHEINTLREKLRDASVLLDVRNQELKVAKTFLSKEDLFSTSDVVQSIRDLNSEIMQTAAYLAETLPLKRTRTPSAEEVPEGPYKSIFVTLVLPPGSGEDVDVESLELALQGFLASYVSQIVNQWGFSHAFGGCDKLYSKVCETEDHTVASNWRVLTHRTLTRMDSSHEDLPGKIVNGMVKKLAELLSSCGVGTSADNKNDIHKCAAEKLRALSIAAQRLNKMIGESVVSEDLMVSVMRGGTMFDGERMEDAYPGVGITCLQRTVICTTDLGLCERKQTKGVRKMLLKPKVVLRNS